MSVEAKQAKQAVIDEIKEKFEGASSVVVVDYLGITVAEADELRKQLREADVDFKVYKNTLIKRAIDGTGFEALGDVLKGSSALAFSKDDPAAAARIIKKAIKSYNKMAFKGGIVEGEFADVAAVEKLADMPTREELIARFLGSLKAPISKFTRTVKAVADAMPEDGTAADLAAKAAENKSDEAPAEDNADAAEA